MCSVCRWSQRNPGLAGRGSAAVSWGAALFGAVFFLWEGQV